MENKVYWLKYLSPIMRILLCPVTILFLGSIWSNPVDEIENDLIEEIQS